MKKRLIYLCALVFVVLSCGEDFAETTQVGDVSIETLSNPQGVSLLLTGAYSALDGVRNNLSGNGFAISGDNWWCDVMSDDAHKGSTDGDQVELFQLETNVINTSNGFFEGRFSAIFSGVNRANATLDLIRNINLDALTTDEIEAIGNQEAEAYFLRAHYNFELTKMWGNVPFISVDNFADQDFNQPNLGPLWDQIEEDFQFAIDNLPNSQDDPGRPTVGVARAYLGKVHLYQQEWTQALTELMTVINSGEFSLASEYLDNFTASGENGPESVFAIQFAVDGGLSLNGNQGSTLNFPGGAPFDSCCGFYMPTIDLANAFIVDGTTGLPNNLDGALDFPTDYNIPSFETDADGNILEDANGDPIPTPFTPDMTTPVDPRLDYTVGRRGIDYNGFGEHVGMSWIRTPPTDISGVYLPKKNVYQANELGNNQGTGEWGQQHSGVNYNIIRYADVLLFAAEAAVETGDLALALSLTNQVRARAQNSTPVQAIDGGGPAANYIVGLYPSFPSIEFAREAVRFERRVELGMEGHRLFDLRRWGVATEVLTRYYTNEARTITNFGVKVGSYNSTFDLFPIPVNAVDISQGVLTQNPGY